MSWKEDDRSRTKRNNVRVFKKNHYRNISRNSKESSPSPRLTVEPQFLHGLIDVADSSDDRFSFRSNPNSWSPINSDDERANEQMKAPDFETLQKVATGNTYTTLSSEKNWNSESVGQDLDKSFEKISYFTLNLALINAGLETIPFYKRMDYPSSMFDKADIRRMNLEAEMAENKYKAVLNNYELNIPDKPDSGKSKRSNSAKSVKSVKNVDVESKSNLPEKIKENEDDLDELLQMTENKMSNANIKEDEPQLEAIIEIEEKKPNTISEEVKVENNAEDIQQWLDQVLE